MKKSPLALYEYWLDWRMSDKITSSILCVTVAGLGALILAYYVNSTYEEAEQAGTQWMLLGDQILLKEAEKVKDEIRVLETLAKTPSLVAAVQSANAERADWTTEAISRQDRAWVEADPGSAAFVNQIAGNATSLYLLDFQRSNPQATEIFITDRHGLNIAMTHRTSDLWQADEDWWTSTFAQGRGSVHLGAMEYDESSRTFAMGVGIPIRDPQRNATIGVLCATLDVSTIVNTLRSVKIGETGNIVLFDASGVVLFSHHPDHLMKPVPDTILSAFTSGESDWERASDMDGNPAVVAYSSLDGDQGQSLDWHLLITQAEGEINQNVIRNLLIGLMAAIVVTGIGVFLSRLIIVNSVTKPLGMLKDVATELSVGSILSHDDQIKIKLGMRKDEMGEISRAFDRLISYFRNAATASTAIANKDLSIAVTPNSDQDELGIAFAKMVRELRGVIGHVAESAETVAASASQLACASDQSGKATNQIATTIQQVALGATQQNQEVNNTSISVDQIGRIIDGVAQGTQEQTQSLGRASHVTAAIKTAIEQVTHNAECGVHGAAQAAEAARSGAQTVESTIRGMQTIQDKFGLSVQKVHEMGKRSEQIDTIVDTIDEIAAQTNLLALNAAIEAARVEAKGEKTVEGLLQQHLLGAAHLVAEMLAVGRVLASNDLAGLAHLARVEVLSIADSDGVIIASNQAGSVGFRFSENPKQESSAFRPLLNGRDGIVIRPIVVRDQDGKPYIYVGVSRRDQRGIVQAGMSAEMVYNLGGYSRGFAVVAGEVRKLAEHAKASTKEIATLIREVKKTVSEAVMVMEHGVRDVEHGSVQATESGKSLAAILQIVETVNQQVREIASAIQEMSAFSSELVGIMGVFDRIVDENAAATQKMTANSSELTRAVENIASVSEENSAAVEEVSASTEEVLAQVEQVAISAAALVDMAKGLQELVAEFNLGSRETNRQSVSVLP